MRTRIINGFWYGYNGHDWCCNVGHSDGRISTYVIRDDVFGQKAQRIARIIDKRVRNGSWFCRPMENGYQAFPRKLAQEPIRAPTRDYLEDGLP